MSSSISLLTLYQITNDMSILSAQKPETFLLSQEQQDKLPPAAREALEQVDQCNYLLYLLFLTFQ